MDAHQAYPRHPFLLLHKPSKQPTSPWLVTISYPQPKKTSKFVTPLKERGGTYALARPPNNPALMALTRSLKPSQTESNKTNPTYAEPA